MGYDINHDYTAHEGNYTPGGNSCDYIVVHNTGNTANASQEASYASSDEHPSSYHYVLDGDDIYQLLCDTDTGWSVGAWPGCEQYIGNRESISIEVCSNGDPFSDDEIAQLGWLVRMLMDAHGIDQDHVVRHYDCHSGHKDCPAAYIDDDAWAELRSRIFDRDERDEDEMTEDQIQQIAAAVWSYQYDKSKPNCYNQLQYELPGDVWEHKLGQDGDYSGSKDKPAGDRLSELTSTDAIGNQVWAHKLGEAGDYSGAKDKYAGDRISEIYTMISELSAKIDALGK